MKDLTAVYPQFAEIRTPESSALHDFNVEGMIANNFGHGDDCEPIDPMRDSRLMGGVPQRKRSA